MEAIIFVGIQGSGKTTFYKERFFNTHTRVSMDLLRTRHRERIIYNACLEGKAKVVVDNTNKLIAEREQYILPARQAKFTVHCYYFVPDVTGCLRRNAARDDAAAIIPEKGLLGTLKQLQPPRFDEGFDEIYEVRIADDGSFLVTQCGRE